MVATPFTINAREPSTTSHSGTARRLFTTPERLQGCDPFAKGAHLPRGEPAFTAPFSRAVVAELVDAQR